ncbi:MAG: hypothetical protein L3J43_03120 [Sulfurovum sp.]|nr:hypothetical protein [Sulfurovum sp.]
MTKEIKISIGILIIAVIAMALYWFIPQSNDEAISQNTTESTEEKIILPQYENNIYQNIPSVKAYLSALRALIKEGKSLLPLPSNELDSDAQKVQDFLLTHPKFLKDTKQGTKLLHNEMMRILPAIISSMDEKTQKTCQSNTCYQAEKYNFVTNATTRAIVDVEHMKLLSLEQYPNMQPDISLRLTRIAQEIALHAPEVKKELGFTPRKKDITMANVRGSMKESPCENTTHLCVAPTFTDHKKEQALWAVVDLTELRFAAAKWAGLGKTTTPACISERSLQNRHIMKNYCQKDTVLEKNGWKITYRLTGSDGLEIRDVTYQGKKVLKSAKIVDWHVSYKQKGGENLDTTTQTYVEGRRVEYVRGEGGEYMFGYNDAMGCPMFSTSVVLPFNGPQVKELNTSDGFMLTQDFRNPKWPMACNYRYENRFEFYKDGSFRVVGVNKGRGCGDNALYRPVMRIDMDIDQKETFWKMKNNTWEVVAHEFKEKVINTKPYAYKVTSSGSQKQGYYLESNDGQFGDKSRGDNATLFITAFKAEEGDQDLLTLGSCCKPEEEGVERYIEDNASIVSDDLVLWYVPHVRNDAKEGQEYCWADTRIDDDGKLEIKVWPCTVGPKFIPIKEAK